MDSPTDFSDFNLEAGEIVDVVVDGRTFRYKKVSNSDELDWAPDYMEIVDAEVEGKMVQTTRQNFGKLNKCKLRNILEAPYSKEHVKKILMIDSEFKDLPAKKREEFLCKLSSDLMGKLMTGINKVEFQDDSVKKNL